MQCQLHSKRKDYSVDTAVAEYAFLPIGASFSIKNKKTVEDNVPNKFKLYSAHIWITTQQKQTIFLLHLPP